MPRTLRRTRSFKKRYRKLGSTDRDDVVNALRQLPTFEEYPSLNVKKLNKKPIEGYSIQQAKANDKIRISFVVDNEWIVLLDVGSHDLIRRTDYSNWTLPSVD